MRERIGKESKIADDEGFQAEQNLRKRRENQQREKNPKARGREKSSRRIVAAVRLHAQIKTGGGAKCKERGGRWGRASPRAALVICKDRLAGTLHRSAG